MKVFASAALQSEIDEELQIPDPSPKTCMAILKEVDDADNSKRTDDTDEGGKKSLKST